VKINKARTKQRESAIRSQKRQRDKVFLERSQPIKPIQSKIGHSPIVKVLTNIPSKITKIESKEKPRTKAEKELHDKMGSLGCIACRNAGLGLVDMDTSGINYVSIHHSDGRVKDHCHLACLPLCQWHHDIPLNIEQAKLYPHVFPLHSNGPAGGKTKWEKINGIQKELIKQVWGLIGYIPEYDFL
jgi:hypothetical protein